MTDPLSARAAYGRAVTTFDAVLAWEKALGGDAELLWWERAAVEGARWL